MRLFINNGLIVDPANNLQAVGNLIVEDGVIREIGMGESVNRNDGRENDIFIDAEGMWIVPGLIDLHVHFREPGFEYKENVESGCRSAAHGGFTTVCCMPNTSPAADCREVVGLIDDKAKAANGVQVLCAGAVTEGQEGKILAAYEEMMAAETKARQLLGKGICAISEDGKTVADEALMLAAMKKAKALDLPFFSHAEPEAEIVERDLRLAEESGCRLHFCHISEKKSLELIRDAKKRGVDVTAETAPHYFSLCSSDVKGDPFKKMNPPLQTQEDLEAVIAALQDGTIDAIATDHAPHHETEKSLPYDTAPNGVIGLETSFAVGYTSLVRRGLLSPPELIDKMSRRPAEILGLDRGSLAAGKRADITIIDVSNEYEINAGDFLSKGKNSPFLGKKVFGRITYTIVDGCIIWGNGERVKTDRKQEVTL
jgi:dihydroorotase